MEISTIKFDSPIYAQVLQLRYKLFFAEQNLSPEILHDQYEDCSTHLTISEHHQLIAYGNLSFG